MNTKIIEKIKKLLRIAHNEAATPNEAEMAAKRAQALMSKHAIDRAMLENDGAVKEEKIKRSEVFRGGRIEKWRLHLLNFVARANNCDSFYSPGHSATCFGHDSNVEVTKELYGWLCAQVEGWAKKEAHGRGRAYASSYKRGMVSRIGERLMEAVKDARKAALDPSKAIEAAIRAGQSANEAAQSFSLVRVNAALERIDSQKAAVEAWKKNNLKLSSGTRSRARIDYSGYSAGRARGGKVGLNARRALS